MQALNKDLVEQFDALIRRDPGRRGLVATEPPHGPLCAGDLQKAAAHLADFGQHAGLVTGFYVPHGDPPAAETDGPPGTLLLAAALNSLNMDVTLLTDEWCYPALAAAAVADGWNPETIVVYRHGSAKWREEFFRKGPGRTLTHLIAVERVGPGHTAESLKRQPRGGPAPLDEFLAAVPADSYNRCHNMRGEIIDPVTADMHRLFEELPQFRPEVKTIGIGDGGNEIGMGSIPWEQIVERLEGEKTTSIPCRVPTDWTLIAGTSNWGAAALAAAVLSLRNRTDVLHDWGRDRQQNILEEMVQHGPAVDGVTGRREPTVDGLPLITYMQPWEGIRSLLGFEP